MSTSLPKASIETYRDYAFLSDKVFIYLVLNMVLSFVFKPVEWLKDDYRTLALCYLVCASFFAIICCYKLCVYMYRSWDIRRKYDFE